MTEQTGRDLWELERAAQSAGIGYICGVDEAGAGPLAGRVYAAAVILPFGLELPYLNDSKKLSEKRRDLLFDQIVEAAVAHAVAWVDEREIDRINILNARMQAMEQAIAALQPKAELALLDGNQNRGISTPNRMVPKGDGRSASIAAASILAKVSRDRYMIEMAERYPGYGFEAHKGYGTKLHYERLRALGPCALHRKSFLKKL